MLPSNFAASGLAIKASKAGVDSCEGLSVEAWAECSARALPSPSVAACCDVACVACRRLLLPRGNASARRESSATSEFSSSILIAFERTFSAKRGACCLGDAVFSRTPNWIGRDFMFVREGDGQTFHWKVSSTFLKGVLNRLGESFSFESERARHDLQIVEILHAGIGDSEFHKCLEFFGNDRFFRIGQQTRARKFQERGIADLGRCGCDDVSETDVNLNGNLCAVEMCNQGHPDAFVVGILGY